MECPNNHGQLQTMLFHHVEVDYCPECLGIFFDEDELRLAKDDSDNQLNWEDVDVWRDKHKFVFSPTTRRCPKCRVLFMEVAYDNSNVVVDFCKHCRGIWLDRGEFKQIMVYLRKKSDYDILHRYAKNWAKQLWEVFAGPETFREELHDFLMLCKLFNYKFVTQYPLITRWIDTQQK